MIVREEAALDAQRCVAHNKRMEVLKQEGHRLQNEAKSEAAEIDAALDSILACAIEEAHVRSDAHTEQVCQKA